MSPFLAQYEPLDIIGNGSFGIIRKVRRKTDGTIFARKELNFEKMTERDRKQIVSEVNILKDLHHEHIVRYHDRYVDRDAGILYILMEYCGGGDLSTVIKQSAKMNRPIPEDTIWNYFMQILLALHHCHHPNGHGRTSSGGSPPALTGDEASSGSGPGLNAKERRVQILHRDLKPDNVFLDENNIVKLGDFGLSKALGPSNFANTYVGTPYYMSPELMQEKAYDTKSDIWSLGCLIYELCALKPPFHEAKTHSELSMCIRNGRIPPLPRGYSQSMSAVVKAMLNLNPAMRPSAAQLLQHERLELSFRVSETDKLLSQVKNHRAAVLTRERELVNREELFKHHEQKLKQVLAEKDAEIARLQQTHITHTQRTIELAVKQAVSRREEELRILIQKREEEVANAMAKREEEIMDAVRRREAEVCQAWNTREAEVRQEVEVSIKAVQERVEWITQREKELESEEERIEEMREQVEEKMKAWEAAQKGKMQKAPLEEVKNILEPIIQTPGPRYRKQINHCVLNSSELTPGPADTHRKPLLPLKTPITRPNYADTLPSAMKGVVLTATGEPLATPSATELTCLFTQTPRVGLGFTKIFESDNSSTVKVKNGNGKKGETRFITTSRGSGTESETDSPPPSPTERKEREWKEKEKAGELSDQGSATSSASSCGSLATTTTTTTKTRFSTSGSAAAPPPLTRLTKPPICSPTKYPPIKRTRSSGPIIAVASTKSSSSNSSSSSKSMIKPKSLSRHKSSSCIQPQQPVATKVATAASLVALKAAPVYDLTDEENLPSPFLKRIDKGRRTLGKIPPQPSIAPSSSSMVPVRSTTTVAVKKRLSTTSSGANYLRAMAAANVVGKRANTYARAVSPTPLPSRLRADDDEDTFGEAIRPPVLLNTRKAMEGAKKVLSSRS
ncbi:hypothetical protein AGABI2DRAFT_118840 [Agaricus bisporus var. bisporus H97]|uniref:hypothetical protein n=1 Tax=Agaricus bisporus var. bisporus (strain H97 / ATCC MYA-4626 / FGSC 10389) TaxID=936046 RepID=UPI00029F5027|nr:hypothetical protein AGABI2DRAFT_118840 [Agaricus bisporus var. bisporus H97]EKV46662.1 hypothetical protein AGABI2DRAFT_118840 [Agaricus bisporus var. bisporus H97]